MTRPMQDEARPLIEHLIELRKRVMISTIATLTAFVLCYLFVEPIYAFLVEPLAASFDGQDDRRLIYTSLTETFFTYVKLAFYAGLFMAFPVIASQLYLFIAPGLYKHERGAFLPYLVISPLLFIAGGALAYYGVMPLAWQFFVSFESSPSAIGLPIQLEAKVSEYLSLVIQMLFAFGLAFQLPVVLTLLARIGVVHPAGLRRFRKYAVILLLIAAAILTPPDVISQIALFIPLYLLYELAIISCGLTRARYDAAMEVGSQEEEGL